MSARGSAPACLFPPAADMPPHRLWAAMCQSCREQVQQHTHATDYLLDHLVGGGEQLIGHGDAERPGGLVVDDQLEFRRLHHRQVRGLHVLEDAVDVAGGAPELIDEIRPIGNQTAEVDEDTIVVDRGQLVAGRQLDDQVANRIRPPPVAIRPPFGARAKAATALSISAAPPTLIGLTSTRSDGATA